MLTIIYHEVFVKYCYFRFEFVKYHFLLKHTNLNIRKISIINN